MKTLVIYTVEEQDTIFALLPADVSEQYQDKLQESHLQYVNLHGGVECAAYWLHCALISPEDEFFAEYKQAYPDAGCLHKYVLENTSSILLQPTEDLKVILSGYRL